MKKSSDIHMKNKGFCLPIITLIFCMCASQGMPPGGPVDKSAPELVETFPLAGSTNVSKDTKVTFIFNEAINPQKADDAIFITPFQGEDVKYRWRGKRLDILFDHPLKENRTYVITLGTGLADYQRNAIDTSQTLAFSTGNTLDKGEIKGRIYGLENAKGVDVWAYLLQDTIEVDPKKQEPEYVVQCTEDGAFHFQYLAPGSYRIFGIRDRIADRLYQPMEDEIGIAAHDAFLPDTINNMVGDVYFQMTLEDTARPTLLQSSAMHREMVMLRFDEAVLPLNQSTIQILDVEDHSQLNIKEFRHNPNNPNMVYCFTDLQKVGTQYQVYIDSVYDTKGNLFDTTFQANKFEGVDFADTLSPKILKIIPVPGTKQVPLNQSVSLLFNESLDSASIDTAFTLADTSGHLIDGKFSWKVPCAIHFSPLVPLNGFTDYAIQIKPNAGFDLYGNAIQDTIIHFKTFKKDTLSQVSGQLSDENAHYSGPYCLTLFQTKFPEIYYNIRLNRPNVYTFKDVLPGLYFIEVIADSDSNLVYTPGTPYPWKPSERYIQMTDTIKVRSRWSNEGNDIRLPK